MEAQQIDAVVVGAGFAGLYLIHKLRTAGFSVVCLEAGQSVGGTWNWNRYPGARCDVPSMDYSYSFSEELQQEWIWKERYASQPEILSYLDHVADRFDLRRSIRFGARVCGAQFDPETSTWTLKTSDGHVVQARYVIMAMGNLSAVQMPRFPGLESFRGTTLHTGNWPHNGHDFAGRRVAVIGTGSSGVQCIPVIAREAEHLTVFQRTPNFSVPAHNRQLTAQEIDARKAIYSDHREQARHSMSGTPPFDLERRTGKEVSPEERQHVWGVAWDAGNPLLLIRAYTDTMTDPEVNDSLATFVQGRIRSIVHDPATAARLTSHSYPIGSKRLCVDSDYYATFNRDNVDLVDVRTTPILRFTDNGIETAEGHVSVDDVVLATGFDAMTGALDAVDIAGSDGSLLREAWAAGPRTYLGVAVTGFPNLFIVTGPGSPSVLSNVVVSIEQHVEWICQALEHVRDHGFTTMEVVPQAQESWTRHVNDLAEGTLYLKADSWFLGANIPGKPRQFMPYLGGVGTYRAECDRVTEAGYVGFRFE